MGLLDAGLQKPPLLSQWEDECGGWRGVGGREGRYEG